MSDLSKLSDADLLAAYKAAKSAPAASPFDAALAAEGVSGPVADLARSIYMQESGGGKNTRTSNAGAVGGMQILPSTFAGVADKDWDINDPTQNARAGIRYLKQGYDAAAGDPALAAAFYYGGPGGLEKARRGVAVSDPRNPNAPNTLQYGQQVAARLPKDKGLIQRGVEAVIPSANAAEPTKNPLEGMSDEELLAAYQKLKGTPTQPAPVEAAAAPEGGGAAFGVYPKARRDAKNNSTDALGSALKGVASGFADVGNTIINSGTKAAANAIPSQPNMLINPDVQRPQAGITNIVSGQMPMSPAEQRNAERAQGLKDFNEENKGAIFSGGRLIGNIAATYPVGGAIAAPIRAAGGSLSASAPVVGNALTKFGNAIASGGMTVGGAAPTTLAQGAGNALLRLGGGAINGAATAGIINPDDAKTGALYGMATPAVAMAVAPVGRAIGNRMAARQAEQAAAYARNAPLTQTLQDGVQAGYVVPPSSVNPTLYNTVKESISGKIATAQVASARNQEVTDRLVRRALGLAEDAPLSTEALQAYRTAQVQAGYEPLRQMGTVRADPQFNQDLNTIIRNNTGRGTIPAIVNDEVRNLANSHRSQGFDAGDAVDAIRQLRENAQDAFRTGNTALGRTNRAIADAYEGAIERSIPANNPQLLQAYRDARANIARSFSVENALKEGTGAVDARKLGAELQKDVPLDGDLLTVARFASAFPKATQPPSMVAGAGVHNLKAGLASASAGAGAYALGPVGAVAGAAYPFLVPPVIRAQMFSQRAQNALIPQAPAVGGNRLLQFAQRPEVQQLMYKAAPIAATQSP